MYIIRNVIYFQEKYYIKEYFLLKHRIFNKIHEYVIGVGLTCKSFCE